MENVVRMVTEQTEIDPISFTDFWTLYPRKVARKAAERAWQRVDPSEHGAILLALAQWRRVWRGRDDDQYTPHAASWLNGERWTDELPAGVADPAHASHAPAKPHSQDGTRSPMPDAVRALLAKIRGTIAAKADRP
jgi:hypothetical protein